MEPTLQSNSLHAFEMICNAAKEYNNSEYKFFKHGFFKYKLEGGCSILIEDIYIIPEFRGTPAASIVLSGFKKFLNKNNIQFLYGYVWKDCIKSTKRLSTFKKWGLKVTLDTDDYYVVAALVEDLK